MAFNPTDLLVIDTETTGLSFWHGDRPFAVPLCDQDGETWYTEWDVDPFTREVKPVESDLRYLRKLFARPVPKILFNAKFDYRMLEGFGLILAGQIHDVGVAARICNTLETRATQYYQLKPLAWKYAEIPYTDEKRLQTEVNRCRRIGKKNGWKLAESTEADYWLPRVVDRKSDFCEEYAITDVERTLMLWLMYDQVVMSDPDSPELRKTYDFEMGELWRAIYKMEQRGIRIDRAANHAELLDARKRKEEETTALRAMLVKDRKKWSESPKEPFNPGSNPQLAKVLYDKKDGYGLTVHRKTKPSKNAPDGNPSTDWKALREHLTHPFVKGIVRARSADKAEGTYFGNYERLMVPDWVNSEEWCIHGNFNQLGANKTSRLSANSPNLQNVGDANNNPNSPAPIQARKPFGPRKGYRWYGCDWDGQEARIFAEVADIDEMLQAFYSGKKIHGVNANLAWGGRNNPHALQALSYGLELGTPSSMVTRPKPGNPGVLDAWKFIDWNDWKALNYGVDSPQALRASEKWLERCNWDIVQAEAAVGVKRTYTRAKNLLFAKIYGAGPGGVMDMLYCSREEAKVMLKRFDTVFPGIVEFSNHLAGIAIEQGYIHNLFGRRLNVDPWFAYRAVNYLVQGTAADMMKRAIVMCSRFLERSGVDGHIVMSIHDEIIFEILEAHSYKWVLRGLRNIMQNVGGKVLTIPMPVEVSRITESWDKKEKVEL